MSARPTADQINAALTRAATAAREHTQFPDRILKQPLPQHGSERRGERWWLIGHIRVLGQPEEWKVLYDPETDEPGKEGKMRTWTPLLIVPVLAIGLMSTLLRVGHDASPVPAGSPAASPVAASPVALGSPAATPLTVAGAMATITVLRATVEAQQVDVAVLTIRVDALETSVGTLLEMVPEQTAMDGFQQAQIDDLMARLAAVEADGDSSPIASPLATPCASPAPS